MPCPVWRANERSKICGKKAVVVLRANYSELHPHLRGESKYYDVFGLCKEHGHDFAMDERCWQRKPSKPNGVGYSNISGLRGIVISVEIIPMDGIDLKAFLREDEDQRTITSLKRELLNKMRQGNTSHLTLEHWRQVFEESLQEFIIEKVQDS